MPAKTRTNSPPPFILPELRLTEEEKQRLLRLAPLFEIHVVLAPPWMTLSGPLLADGPVVLPMDVGIARLLAELCSVTTRWIAYGPKRYCERYLLAVTDERFARLSELYFQWKAQNPKRFGPAEKTPSPAGDGAINRLS
jgi:hypothetical protein